MRLLTKTFAYYICLAVAIFAVGGVISYFLISHVFYDQVDEGITTEKEIIAEEIETNENIPDYSLRFGHQIEVVLLNRPGVPHHFIKDTTYTVDVSPEKFRYLYYSGNRKGNREYIIKIFHPLAETNDLIEGILLVTFSMFSCLFLLLIVVNYFTSKKIWIPFYHTIHQLNRYNINEKKGLSLSGTEIYEFDTLNKVLNNMSEKILADYSNMKEFTENASHEIQTPLAIIKSKIEVLVQSGKFDEEQMDAIQTINDAVYRLAKLNSGLILISKIDNRQFHADGVVNLIAVIEKILDEFEDLIAMKDLHVEKSLGRLCEVKLNPELGGILVSNLVSNAIKHNVPGGFIRIIQQGDTLLIGNSGLPLSVPEEELFKRFVKNDSNSKSLGLGLAIIKRICDQYSIAYNYTCNGREHVFQLDFQSYRKE